MHLVPLARLDVMVVTAAKRLAAATDAAGVLEARQEAGVVYTAARAAARIARARHAHEEVVRAAHIVAADALDIEALAERKLAEQYDRAREAGEVRGEGGNQRAATPRSQGSDPPPTMADLGLDSRMISRGRALNEIEVEDPGAVRRTLDAALAEGEAPTREDVRRLAIREAVKPIAEHMKANGFIFAGVLHIAQGFEPLAEIEAAEAARRIALGHRWKFKQLPLHALAAWFEAFATEMDQLEDPHADIAERAGAEGAAG